MATPTMSSASPSGTPKAPHQGGVLEGMNPAVYDSKNPITVFIIQAGIIIIFCRLLHYPLSKLRQPRVIAEVIGGIILGPSILGRIPGFSASIFPVESLSNLNLVANLGLLLFLFLVGLEVDLRFLVSNWKIALGVGAAGMALPFGLGAAIAWGLYNQFPNEAGINFGVFMLFIGVAMAITAFPVLCRILTELKLLNTPVGIIVLSAGVGNDVVGWILLALCVALVNAGSGLSALWVLLVAVGYVLCLVYAIKPAFLWALRKTGSIQNGPSQSIVALTLLLVLASAFFTNIIGIHAIFGAFMVGLICPHEGGFAIKLTEKIEDLVCALFLPLYFALSGLSTNLGLLDDGITWAYVIGVIAIAFFAKVVGGAVAARIGGLVWRESFTIGALMSCKGLVELIVLNIGLQAKILSTRTFTIFVVMALVTTFATTPLVSALYPQWYQAKLNAWKRGEIDWDGNRLINDDSSDTDSRDNAKAGTTEVSRIIANVRLDSMSGVLALVSLLASPSATPQHKVHPSKAGATQEAEENKPKEPLQVDGVRLTELTERSSSVMKVTELEEYSQRDPVLNTLRTFGQLSNVAVSGKVILGPGDSLASTLAQRAKDVGADLMLVPWSESGGISDFQTPFAETPNERFANGSFSHFVATILGQETCDVAVFVDNGFGSMRKKSPRTLTRTVSAMSSRELENETTMPVVDRGHHVFLPFFGTTDDKMALRLVLQLAKDPSVTATIVLFDRSESMREKVVAPIDLPETPKTPATTQQENLKSLNAAVQQVDQPSLDTSFFASMRDSLSEPLSSRIMFETVDCTSPASDALERAKLEVGQAPKNAGDLVVLGRNSPFAAVFGEDHSAWTDSEAGKALGPVAGGIIKAKLNASLLVLRASV